MPFLIARAYQQRNRILPDTRIWDPRVAGFEKVAKLETLQDIIEEMGNDGVTAERMELSRDVTG